MFIFLWSISLLYVYGASVGLYSYGTSMCLYSYGASVCLYSYGTLVCCMFMEHQWVYILMEH